jgi:hypothetical protein
VSGQGRRAKGLGSRCAEGLQGARTQGRRRGCAQGREGGGRGRGRERRREGSSPRGSNFGDHRLQNLGHHGERERWERESLLRERNQMREKGPGARMGSRGCQGHAGRAGPGWAGLGQVGLGTWAGLGCTTGQNPVARTTTDRKSFREAKSETKLSNARD